MPLEASLVPTSELFKYNANSIGTNPLHRRGVFRQFNNKKTVMRICSFFYKQNIAEYSPFSLHYPHDHKKYFVQTAENISIKHLVWDRKCRKIGLAS